MPVVDHRASPAGWSVPTAETSTASDDGASVRHEPTNAEWARTVVGNNRVAVVSVTVGEDRNPLGFVVPYVVNDRGTPFLGIRAGIEEGAHLRSPMPASLTASETPLTASHSGGNSGVTLTGSLRLIVEPSEEFDAVFKGYARSQPADSGAVKRGASRLFCLELNGALIASETGEILRVPLDEYSTASSDPLAAVAPGLVSHLTSDNGGSLVLLCRAFGGAPGTLSARLAGIDQYGMDVLVQTAHGRESVRLAFTHTLATSEEVRKELTVMARAARFKLGVG